MAVPPITNETTARAVCALRDAFAADLPALRSPRTQAALDYLDRALSGHWSVEQFRLAAELENPTARWQNVNASLRAIEVSLAAQRSA